MQSAIVEPFSVSYSRDCSIDALDQLTGCIELFTVDLLFQAPQPKLAAVVQKPI
jgi:hypothetical protein